MRKKFKNYSSTVTNKAINKANLSNKKNNNKYKI